MFEKMYASWWLPSPSHNPLAKWTALDITQTGRRWTGQPAAFTLTMRGYCGLIRWKEFPASDGSTEATDDALARARALGDRVHAALSSATTIDDYNATLQSIEL
jgi:hypothetical protein